jgi:hypothetical protein
MYFNLFDSDFISLVVGVYVLAMIWFIRKDVKEIRKELRNLKVVGEAAAVVAHEPAYRSAQKAIQPEAFSTAVIQEELKPISVPVPTPSSAAHRASSSTPSVIKHTHEEVSRVVVREDVISSDPIGNFFAWLRIDWPMKVGALFILIALGYFVSYAVVPSIGPVGRISIGIITSAIIMIVSLGRFGVSTKQGASLLVLGASGVLLSLFAARTIYKADNVIEALPALILMLGTVASVMLIAVKKNMEKLGLAAVILAIISPFLTNGENDHLGLLQYSLMVLLGVVLVVARTHWRSLLATLATYFTVLLLGLASAHSVNGHPHWGVDLTASSWIQLLGYASIAVFFIASFAGSLRGVVQRYGFDAFSIGLASVMLLDWVYSFETSDIRPFVLLAWTFMIVIASYAVYKRVKDATMFYVSAAIATVFLAIFLAWVLSGPALTLAYAFGLLALLEITRRIRGGDVILPYLFLGYFGLTVRGVMHSFKYADRHDAFSSDFVAVIAVLAALAIPFFVRPMLSGYETIKKAMLGLAVAWALIFYWPFAYNLFASVQEGTVFALVSYALFGVALYAIGIMRAHRTMYMGGMALLGFVSAHIVLIEASSLEVAMRALVFALVGGLMLSTVFIRKALTGNEK